MSDTIETQGKEIIEPKLLYTEDEERFELGIQAIMDFQEASSKNVKNNFIKTLV